MITFKQTISTLNTQSRALPIVDRNIQNPKLAMMAGVQYVRNLDMVYRMEEESVQDYILELIFNLLVQIRALNNNQLKSQPSTHTITQLTKVLQNTLINNQKIIQAQARNLNIKQEVNLLYDNINQFQELVKSGEIDRVIDKVQQVRLSDPQTKTQITSLSNEITTKLLTELLQQKESISEFTKEQVVELTTEVIRSLSSETLPVELTRNISNILLLELPQQIAKDLSNELLKVVTTEHSIASEYRPESAVEINKERFVELASERLVKVASQVLTERSRFPYQIYNSNVVNRQAHIQAQAQKAQGYQLEGLVLQHHQDQLTLQARQQLIDRTKLEQQSQLGQQTILEQRSQQLEQTQIEQQSQSLEQIRQERQLVPGILYEEAGHEFGQRPTGRPPLSMGDVAIDSMMSSWQTNNATNWQLNFTNSWQNDVYLAYLTQNNITQDYGMQEYAIQNYIAEQLPNIQSKALNKALVKAIQAATLKTIKPASANTLQTVVDHITAKAMKTFDDRIVAKAMKTFDDRIVAKAMKTFDDRIVAKAMKTFDDRIVAKAMKTVEDIIKADNMLMIANRPLQISATDNELQESQLATTLPAALPKVIAAISTLLPSDTPIEIIDSVKRRIVNAVTRTSMISTSIEDSRKQVRKVVSKITGDLQLNHKIDVSQEFLIDTIQSAIEAEYTSYQKLPGKPEFIYGSLQQSDDQIGSRMVIVNQPPVIGDIIHRQTPSITAPSVDSVQLEADTYAESMKVQYQSEPSYSTDSTTHHVFPSQAADADLQRQIDQRIEEIDFESIISVTSIADKVYQKLERRLTSERRRRGLL